MKAHKGMRPFDVVILYQIILDHYKFTHKDLGNKLFISYSEIANSINRSKISGLIKWDRVQVDTLVEFIHYGLPYVFPAIEGRPTRGIPTASFQEIKNFQNHEHVLSDSVYVWPYSEGWAKGISIDPLYPNMVLAVKENSKLYDLLSFTEMIRVGKVREKEIALNSITQILINEST